MMMQEVYKTHLAQGEDQAFRSILLLLVAFVVLVLVGVFLVVVFLILVGFLGSLSILCA